MLARAPSLGSSSYMMPQKIRQTAEFINIAEREKKQFKGDARESVFRVILKIS